MCGVGVQVMSTVTQKKTQARYADTLKATMDGDQSLFANFVQ